MTEGRGDQGFSVAPRRIGEPPNRRRRIPRPGAAAVGVIAVALIAIGVIGPRLTDRPSFDTAFFATPTPDPSRTADPTPTDTPFGTPAPTTLPEISRPTDSTLNGHLLYETTRLESIDLANGTVTDGPDVQLGQDALLPARDGGGWICVCFEDNDDFTATDVTHKRTVILRRIDLSGREVD